MSRGYAVLGLINPKHECNVGGVMRAAHCYKVAGVYVQGKRYKKESSDVHKTWRHIPVLNVDTLVAPLDCQMVAVELTDGAEDLTTFQHPQRAMYIFGPEDGSIPPKVLAQCPHKVKIATQGCMNLAATANVVLYDRLAKQTLKKLQTFAEGTTL